MKVLLISFQKDMVTIGLKYIHYYLLNSGHQSSILYIPDYDFTDEKMHGEVKRFIQELNPGLIGFSLMSLECYQSADLTRRIKKYLPNVPIVWGGIHPTIDPEGSLEYCDYACIGEGEESMLDFANALEKKQSLQDIKNMAYKKDGTVIRNPLYPLCRELDKIPAFEHIPSNSFMYISKRVMPLDVKIAKKMARHRALYYGIMASRGCPYSCTYCCNNIFQRLYEDKTIRRRSVENIILELEKAVKDHPYLKFINFQDDCFIACSNEYLEEFCKAYKQRINKPFIIRAIPAYINDQKLKMLKDAGVSWINLGLQSGSDRTNKDIFKRRSTSKIFLQAAQQIHDNQIAAFYDVIVDNPLENMDDQLATIETLMDTPKPFFPEFFSLTFYLGTEIREMALKDCPDKIDDPNSKDFFYYNTNRINQLIRMAAFLSKPKMNKLLNFYKENPSGFKFKFTLALLSLYTTLWLEPFCYFEVFRLSLGGSYLKTMVIIPHFFVEGVWRYLKQFESNKPAITPDMISS